MNDNGEVCKSCGGFTDTIITMNRDKISVCEPCSKKEEYSKNKARTTTKYVPMSAMKLLPPREGLCPECAVDHPPDLPHNKSSMYYQTSFRMKNNRWPTWEDAMAHCSDQMKTDWREAMKRTRESTEAITGPKPEGFWD